MSTILPESPSFAALLGRGLGQGLSSGIGRSAEFAQQMAAEKAKQKSLLDIIQPRRAQKSVLPEDIKSAFLESLPSIEQAVGRELTPSDLDTVFERLQHMGAQPSQEEQAGLDFSEISPEQELAVAQMNPAVSRMISESKKRAQKQTSEATSRAFSETQDYRKHAEQQARSAKELEPVLEQMETLISRGKLTNPIIAKLADKFGLVGVLDPTSQQFQALSIGFLQNAKNMFGARLTNFDVQTYLDKIPRLAQTNAGKKALISNFRSLGKAAEIRNKTKNKIIKENRGVPPIDIEEQVEERVAPELDKLYKDFNKSFVEASKTKSGKILMRHPSGAVGEVPEDRVDEAIQKGYALQ